MHPSDDELLHRYAHERSEAAFATLVTRHLDLVSSAALRQVRRSDLAQDVAQTVFLELARQAPRVKPDIVLGAWLHTVPHRRALDVIRSETRRQHREQASLDLAQTDAPATEWTDVAPLLNDALQSLPTPERDAVLSLGLGVYEVRQADRLQDRLAVAEQTAAQMTSRTCNPSPKHSRRPIQGETPPIWKSCAPTRPSRDKKPPSKKPSPPKSPAPVA